MDLALERALALCEETGALERGAWGLYGIWGGVIRQWLDELLPEDVDVVPYESLRAFNSGGGKGWGVCCTLPIKKGQVVGEAYGRCLTEEQFAALDNKVYVFSFDDEMLKNAWRQIGDS